MSKLKKLIKRMLWIIRKDALIQKIIYNNELKNIMYNNRNGKK